MYHSFGFRDISIADAYAGGATTDDEDFPLLSDDEVAPLFTFDAKNVENDDFRNENDSCLSSEDEAQRNHRNSSTLRKRFVHRLPR